MCGGTISKGSGWGALAESPWPQQDYLQWKQTFAGGSHDMLLCSLEYAYPLAFSQHWFTEQVARLGVGYFTTPCVMSHNV